MWVCSTPRTVASRWVWVVVEDLATVVVLEMTGYAVHRLGVSPQEIALIARGLRSR